jgi:hypothetical protein
LIRRRRPISARHQNEFGNGAYHGSISRLTGSIASRFQSVVGATTQEATGEQFCPDKSVRIFHSVFGVMAGANVSPNKRNNANKLLRRGEWNG